MEPSDLGSDGQHNSVRRSLCQLHVAAVPRLCAPAPAATAGRLSCRAGKSRGIWLKIAALVRLLLPSPPLSPPLLVVPRGPVGGHPMQCRKDPRLRRTAQVPGRTVYSCFYHGERLIFGTNRKHPWDAQDVEDLKRLVSM